MRALKTIIVILAIAVAALSIGLNFLKSDEKDAPTITCNTDVIKVPCKATDEEIIKFFTAKDNQDGDLTDKIIIERKAYFISPGKTEATFAVIDSDKNVTSIKGVIEYTDYEAPKIEMLTDMILSTDNKYNLTDNFKATDVFDGDISKRVKIISSDYNALVPGYYSANVKATNSKGDYSDFSFDIIVTDRKFSTSIKLKQYLVETEVGKNIDYASFISHATSQTGPINTANIRVDSSKVNINKPGVYNVFYTIGDINAPEGMTRLVLIVKGEEK